MSIVVSEIYPKVPVIPSTVSSPLHCYLLSLCKQGRSQSEIEQELWYTCFLCSNNTICSRWAVLTRDTFLTHCVLTWQILLQGRNPGVLWEYTMPRTERKPDYSWGVVRSDCSAPCAGGETLCLPVRALKLQELCIQKLWTCIKLTLCPKNDFLNIAFPRRHSTAGLDGFFPC